MPQITPSRGPASPPSPGRRRVRAAIGRRPGSGGAPAGQPPPSSVASDAQPVPGIEAWTPRRYGASGWKC